MPYAPGPGVEAELRVDRLEQTVAPDRYVGARRRREALHLRGRAIDLDRRQAIWPSLHEPIDDRVRFGRCIPKVDVHVEPVARG